MGFIQGALSTSGKTAGVFGTSGLFIWAGYQYTKHQILESISGLNTMAESVMEEISGTSFRASDWMAQHQNTTQKASETFNYFRNGGLGLEAGQLFSSNAEAFFEQANLTHIQSKISDEIFANIRKTTLGEAEKIRSEIQNMITAGAKETALSTMPWIVLSCALAVAAPTLGYYGVRYLYDRFVHELSKPKLAQEKKSANVIDRAYEIAQETFSVSYESLKTYLTWKIGAEGAVLMGSVFLAGAAWTMNFNSLCNYFRTFLEQAMYENFFPDYELRAWKYQNQEFANSLLNYNNISMLTSLVALGVLGKRLYKIGKSYYKNEWLVDSKKPIFAPEVAEVVDELIANTYNLQKNGGYFQNLLLYGPAGTGKTMLSKCIARGANMNYIMMSGGDLAQYIKRGEHVTELNRLFDEANRAVGSTIIFIDEAESLCKDRNQLQRDEAFELLNAFLNQTGTESNKFMLILSTNRMEDIDDAVLSRMDRKLHIGVPQLEERKEILKRYLHRFFSDAQMQSLFNPESIETIAKAIEGFSGRTIFKLVNALHSKQKSSPDDILTPLMRNAVVHQFVEQEREVQALRGATA